VDKALQVGEPMSGNFGGCTQALAPPAVQTPEDALRDIQA
jgi:hypothetical protein